MSIVRILLTLPVIAALAPSAFADSTIYYTYDPLGRLATVCYASNGEKITYTYDAAGNRSQVVTQGSTCP